MTDLPANPVPASLGCASLPPASTRPCHRCPRWWVGAPVGVDRCFTGWGNKPSLPADDNPNIALSVLLLGALLAPVTTSHRDQERQGRDRLKRPKLAPCVQCG